MANTTNLTIRIDKDTKREAEILAYKLGTSLSNAVNILITGFVRNYAFPQEYVSVSRTPSAELEEALEESEAIANAIRTMTYRGKKYTDRNRLLADMQADADKEFAEWEGGQDILEKTEKVMRRTIEVMNA